MTLKMLQSNYGGISLGDDKDTDEFKYFTYLDFPNITSAHKNIMSSCLTKQLFDDLKHKVTSSGFSFSNSIQSGIENPQLKVGLAAGDKETYQRFKALFYRAIKILHNFDPSTDIHRHEINPEKLDLRELQKLDLEKYIISTRIRAVRNINDFTLPPGTSNFARLEVESILKSVFQDFTGSLKGVYHNLENIDQKLALNLRKKGILFQGIDSSTKLFSTGSTRHWPKGRGLFLNQDENILCWVNEEDHCHIISLQIGSDIKNVFENFAHLSKEFEKVLNKNRHTVMSDDILGFISTCPSNLGTGLRVSVKIKLHKLLTKRYMLEEICSKAHLNIRSEGGEGESSLSNVLDISNKETIGFTETELVQKLVNGLVHIISAEKNL